MMIDVIVLTTYVLLRLCSSIIEMFMTGMPKMVKQVVPTSHCRVIRKYMALPEMKKMPRRMSTKYLKIL